MEKLAPDIPKFITAEVGIGLMFAYWLGLLPFIRIYHDVFSCPYMTRDYLRGKLI